MSDAALAVLMRWPRRGQGKSRLAAEVGVDAAHRLHCAFVADTLGWPQPRPRTLAVALDAGAVAAARAAAPDALVVEQPDGDLGARIAAALQAAFRRGAQRAVLVGTDSPSLPHHLLAACLDAAAQRGAAMVPAEDGGFVALAVHRDAVHGHGLEWLQDGIAWSTDRTAAQVCAAAAARGLDVTATAPWFDVDTAADLDRLYAGLRRAPVRAPLTLRCLGELGWGGIVERAS